MENTQHLRQWIQDQVDSAYDGNLTAFSDRTAVSRQTWMNILSTKYRSLRQQAVDDLCDLFDLTEIQLYQIAHPETGAVHEGRSDYKPRDEAERLASFLRKASKKDREFIYQSAERCGFKRREEK